MDAGRDYREEEKIDPEERGVWAPLEMIRISHQPEKEAGKVTTQGKNQPMRPEESRKMNREIKIDPSRQAGSQKELSKHFLNKPIQFNFCFKDVLKNQSLKYES